MKIVNKTKDGKRLQVLEWMEWRVKESLYTVSEKRMFDTIQNVYEISLVSKTFTDPSLSFYSLKFFGCLLMHLNYSKWAIKTFEVMRDLGYELLNWSFVIQSFDLLGRCLQNASCYKDAMIAYKKMLQLAWVTNSQEYEIRAYMGLARQFFYDQNLVKCKFYLKKAHQGDLEPLTSR